MSYTAHEDTFARENLPPQSEWPEMDFSSLAELNYPKQLNCATELLDTMVNAGHAESPLFHTPEGIWTYRQMLEKSNQIAHVLVDDIGLKPGHRVLLRGPNTPMLAACWFGVVKAGGICVTTMPLLRAKELSYTVEKTKIRHCLCDGNWADEITKTQTQTPMLEHVLCFGGELESKMSSKPLTFENVQTAADDVVLLAFTSGTTGNPKATVHFHRDVMAICDCFPRSTLRPNANDIFTGTPPFAFTFGLGALLLFPMRFGASVALVEKPGASSLLETIQNSRATICFTSPTAYRAILDQTDTYDVSSLKKCVSAGETLPRPTFDAWEQKLGIRLIDGIGATELLHIFISAAGDDIRPGATGKPLPGYQAKVMDENGNEVPPGTVGLLAVKGPTGCRYLADERQRTYVRDGWNYTGDAYIMDSDGYFWFQARADDMIISSGYNISGIEVEDALLAHPDVKECGVIGVPNPERGQIVKAFVVLREKAPDNDKTKVLQDFVKQEIAPYKYPREIEFLDALPRTETGKLQRFRLRDLSMG